MTPSTPPIPARPELALRAATLADVELLAAMHTRSRASAYRGMLSDDYLDGAMPEENRAHWRERMPGILAGGGHVLIAQSQGEPVALVCMLAPDDEGSVYIDNLHAMPEHKGLGAGSALLAAAGRWSRDQGARCMHLRVLEDNHQAIGFYESRGWRCVGRVDDVMGGQDVIARVYVLPLADSEPQAAP